MFGQTRVINVIVTVVVLESHSKLNWHVAQLVGKYLTEFDGLVCVTAILVASYINHSGSKYMYRAALAQFVVTQVNYQHFSRYSTVRKATMELRAKIQQDQ